MIDDFFAKIDQELANVNKSVAFESSVKDDNLLFAEQAIKSAIPIVNLYATKMRDRKTKVELGNSDFEISFKLYYKNIEYKGIRMAFNRNVNNKLQFWNLFTENGRSFSSTDGIYYDKGNWSVSIIESKLQVVIEDFVRCAPRYGGTESLES